MDIAVSTLEELKVQVSVRTYVFLRVFIFILICIDVCECMEGWLGVVDGSLKCRSPEHKTKEKKTNKMKELQ